MPKSSKGKTRAVSKKPAKAKLKLPAKKKPSSRRKK